MTIQTNGGNEITPDNSPDSDSLTDDYDIDPLGYYFIYRHSSMLATIKYAIPKCNVLYISTEFSISLLLILLGLKS